MTQDNNNNNMGRKIFLDVGSNVGQTIEEVIKPIHKFDLVFGFEPMEECCDIINEKFKSDILKVYNFGFYKENCEKVMFLNSPKFYGGNPDLGGSIYLDKVDRMNNVNDRVDKICHFKDVGEWFKNNIKEDDYVIMKLNVEGSECDIVERLIESGEYDKIDKLLIDFDCRKIPSQQHRENEVINLLKSLNKKNYIDYFPAGQTHGDRINNFINNINCSFE